MGFCNSFWVYCDFPTSFKQEIIALKSISLRKFSLLVSMYEFLKFNEKNVIVNLYDLPTPSDRVTTIRFDFDLNLANNREFLIYEMYLCVPNINRAILMRNVYFHTARKIIVINNPTTDIQIFDFKQGKMVRGDKYKCNM